MGTWLKKYLDNRRDYFTSAEYLTGIKECARNADDCDFLYQMIHPTGLIYGCPIQLPYGKAFDDFTLGDREEIKRILLENFIHCSIFTASNDYNFPVDPDAIVLNIGKFYENIIPEISRNPKAVELAQSNPYTYIEYILHIRTFLDDLFVENNFTGYFFYSFLSLDIYFYLKWLKSPEIPVQAEFEDVLATLLKLFIAAAYSNTNDIKRGEKILFENFIRAIKLPESKEKETLKFLKGSISLDNIDLSAINIIILKKICFDIILMVIWSDNILTLHEQRFINGISDRLKLSSQETEESMAAIQKFVYENWDNKVIYNNKINYRFLHNGLYNRLTQAINKNKSKILNEVYESKELVELLSKSTTQDLTTEEKEKVKSQLLDILKTIPSLAIFLLPGGTIILPVLLKVLPRQILLPSSFRQKKKE
ncbi:MAG: hypothetical protein HY958_10435 [Bacteroidia bacterium]|nr:hypothetical protein [Bacteroidia bacterium]